MGPKRDPIQLAHWVFLESVGELSKNRTARREGSNLGPTSQKLADCGKSSIAQFRKDNPDFTGPIPADLLTSSGSGLDPHISPASAEAQVARVATARGVAPERISELVVRRTEGRQWGLFGEPRVNVLLLNLDLDQNVPARK